MPSSRLIFAVTGELTIRQRLGDETLGAVMSMSITKDERRTLREMGVFHPYPRTRMRVQEILQLSRG
jgi:hypothetical protein